MPFLSRIFGRKKNGPIKRELTLCVIGASRVGKTTFTRYLETGQPVLDEPNTTLGIDYRKNGVKIKNWNFQLIDIGGQKKFQTMFYELGISQSDIIVFVIDASIHSGTDKELYRQHVEQFKYSFGLISEETAVVILLNKQDLEESFKADELTEYYDKKYFVHRTVAVVETSAKYGNGVDKVIDWIIETMGDKN